MSRLVEYKHEAPAEFIQTLHDILVDGDGLEPGVLVRDIEEMIDAWLKEEQVRAFIREAFPGEDIHTLDIITTDGVAEDGDNAAAENPREEQE